LEAVSVVLRAVLSIAILGFFDEIVEIFWEIFSSKSREIWTHVRQTYESQGFVYLPA
jgi:hypothetical protein